MLIKKYPLFIYNIIKSLKTYTLLEDIRTGEQIKVSPAELQDYEEYDPYRYDSFYFEMNSINAMDRYELLKKYIRINSCIIVKYSDGRMLYGLECIDVNININNIICTFKSDVGRFVINSNDKDIFSVEIITER